MPMSESEAVIVLCGGRSRRMGRDKWSLPFGDETLLQRTVRLAREVVDEVVVVAREGQDVEIDAPVVRDPAEGFGPLAGLVAGLAATEADRVFLTSCDVPFLRPAYVRRMFDLAAGHPLAVPLVDGYHMSTSAVYGREVLPVARGLLAARRLRPFFLLEAFPARIVEPAELLDVDPDLASFRNCNTPEEYGQALAAAGLAT
jgi:molybdopterin-guanine dinucleotide biosynthesis protein A